MDYFEWHGSQFTDDADRRARIVAAGEAIHAHEKGLTEAMLHGTGNQKGLVDMPTVTIIGGVDNQRREGLVTLAVAERDSPDVVTKLRQRGVRTLTRKADHYSANIRDPLGLSHAVRVSMCHYNTEAEVAQFLHAMHEITEGTTLRLVTRKRTPPRQHVGRWVQALNPGVLQRADRPPAGNTDRIIGIDRRGLHHRSICRPHSV